MNDKLKAELEKLFQSSNQKKIITGDWRLNVSVDNKFIFPYNHLDNTRKILADTVKNYTIYFVMSCGRKEIKSYKVNNKCIDIKYLDIDNGVIETLTISLIHDIFPDGFLVEMLLPFLQYEICKCGSTFKVYISPEKMLELKRERPEVFRFFPQVCIESNCFYVELDIYYLIQKNKKNAVEEYDLLYIGKSNAEESDFDILERLNAHKTIQKITRDNNLYYRSKELMLMLFSFNSKLFKEENSNDGLMNIVLGDLKWESEKLLNNVTENQELVLLIEVILINYFKPKYNYQYVEKIPMESKIYEKFDQQKINPISIELDLSMPWGKIKLKTKNIRTETKMCNLECYKRDNEIVIEHEDISDLIYDFL